MTDQATTVATEQPPLENSTVTSPPITVQTPPAIAAPPVVASLADFGISTEVAETHRVTNEDGTFTTDFNDESIKNYDFELYSGRKNQTDRLMILKPTMIAGARVHFKNGAGYFVCHSKFVMENGNEICRVRAKCCEMCEPPTKRFAAMVLQFNTRPDGSLVEPFGFTLKLWRFTADKFSVLRTVNKNFPLTQHDINVLCTEEKFQKLTVQAIPKEKSLAAAPKFWKMFGPTINPWMESMGPKLLKAIGKKLSEQEMAEKLGLATTPSVVNPTLPAADIQDLIG